MSRSLCFVIASLMLCLSFTVYAADTAGAQTKTGVIKSVDVMAKTFVVTVKRPLTFTVDAKTIITLNGKASTLEAAIKPERMAAVTYVKSGDTRPASKVDITLKAPK